MSNSDIIEVSNLTVSFDGFVVLDDLSFSLKEGELRFLIGPNGAGKTTLMDVISGKTSPSAGKVIFRTQRPVLKQEIDVAKQHRHELVRLGLGRKFQTPSIYRSLSCFENIEVALGFRSTLPMLLRRLRTEQRERVEAVLEQVGLADRRRVLAGELSHGEQQWLEIAMLLVQDPSVLLLDEPVAGMTRRERERTGALLHELEGDRSILITEHDMEFVREFSRTVTVLHQGRLLAEGTAAEIQTNEQVVEVYLGRSRVAGAA